MCAIGGFSSLDLFKSLGKQPIELQNCYYFAVYSRTAGL